MARLVKSVASQQSYRVVGADLMQQPSASKSRNAATDRNSGIVLIIAVIKRIQR
jgi:hypothetical protein